MVLAHPDAGERAALRGALSHAADQLIEVGDSDTLVEAACRARPDAIIAHEAICDSDLAALTSMIKTDPDLFDIAIVGIVADAPMAATIDHLERGAHHLVAEPVSASELVAAVRSAVRTTRLQRELLDRAHALERLAYRDALTDVPNRRYLLRRLSALRSAADRHGRPLSLAIADIDHFKTINDMFGHQIGDDVLVEVAVRLTERLRTEDEMGRYGGEEFLVLLPETDEHGAAGAAAALRAAVSAYPVMTSKGPVAVTMSIGYATLQAGEPEADLVARADDALYRAKRRGRNRAEAAVALA